MCVFCSISPGCWLFLCRCIRLFEVGRLTENQRRRSKEDDSRRAHIQQYIPPTRPAAAALYHVPPPPPPPVCSERHKEDFAFTIWSITMTLGAFKWKANVHTARWCIAYRTPPAQFSSPAWIQVPSRKAHTPSGKAIDLFSSVKFSLHVILLKCFRFIKILGLFRLGQFRTFFSQF